MAKFGNLKKFHIDPNKTVDYTFYNLILDDKLGPPILKVKPAGEINKPYFNAINKKNKKLISRIRNSGSINVLGSAEEIREKSYSPFSEHVADGWNEAVIDEDKKKVKFSAENCEEFLRAIPEDEFDSLRLFCLDLNNFRDPDSMDEKDAEELAKN